jgi:phage shock protein A
VRKHLVAFMPHVLDEVEALLEARCRVALGDASDDLAAEALREVKRAKDLYAGKGPVRLL